MITKNISHFGVLVHDAEAATKLWTESFGLQKFDDRRIDVEGIRSIFVSVGGTWDEMVIEIMEPLDKSNMDNALSKRLALVGAGFGGTLRPRHHFVPEKRACNKIMDAFGNDGLSAEGLACHICH